MEVTKEEIQEWKKMYGTIYKLSAEGKVAYIKKPTRQIIGNAIPIAATNPMAYAESIIDNCWLGGDVCIKNDDDFFLGVFEKIQEITKNKTVELEKL